MRKANLKAKAKKKVKAIVTGSTELGLCIIRGLGVKNIPVIALYYGDEDVGQHSKYVSEKARVPSPRYNPNEFLQFLLKKGKECKEWKGSLLIPNGDDALEILANNKKLLSKYYIVGTNGLRQIKITLDKKQTYDLANKLGVRCPKTFYPNSMKDIEKNKNKFVFPCIIKPLSSHKFYSKFKQKLFEAKDYQDLKSKFKKIHLKNHKVMISEIIPGPDHDMYEINSYFDRKDFQACSLARKLRQNPPKYGVARVIKTVHMIPELKESTRKILRELAYQGHSQLEFKRDSRTGEFVLIEINSRITLFCSLLTKAGINHAYIMYKDLVENKKIKVKDYQKNICWIDTFSDFSNTLLRHKQEKYTFWDYIRPYFKKKVFAVLDFKDMKPFVMKLGLKFRKLFNILIGKTKVRTKVY